MKCRVFLAFAFLLTCLPALADDTHHHGMEAGEKLGSVSFPISCKPGLQTQFERGVALLDSFEFESADNQFKDIAKQDPKCAVAYWGQAMSLYHELWNRPGKEDLARGGELLATARKLNSRPRERDYIDALTVFYSNTEKIDHKERAVAYSRAMEGVYQRHPEDREAGVFYALSLLGSAPEEDPTLANPRKAVAILNKLFDEQPDHPGIAHFIIHACDNPQMAPLALNAARKYAAIAPSSAHAVHMPSHIFARLGLWRDSIASNAAAVVAADKMAAMHLHSMHHRMHAMDYEHYAYLQIGDDAHAQAIADELKKFNRQDVESDYRGYYDDMLSGFAARYAIERRQWKDALALQPPAGTEPNIQLQTYWARTVGAGHLHDASAAKAASDKYEELFEQVRKGKRSYLLNGLKNEHEEVQAWLAFAQDKTEDATRIMRGIADRQDKIGKGETESPAREMLADMLLETGDARQALAEYEISLKTDPNRFNELFGAAQAAEKLNDNQKASALYGQLLKNCDGVNSDRAELTKAKTVVAAM